MAKTVEKMPTVRRGRPEKYPYKDWFNGRNWALTEGEDFTVTPESFKAAIYARKTALGFEVRTRTVKDEKTGIATVYVQRLTGAVAKNYRAKRAVRAKA